ncbi:hypothetical protein PMAYCL1PPCAC_32252, partial [Pristionchus mayeri]
SQASFQGLWSMSFDRVARSHRMKRPWSHISNSARSPSKHQAHPRKARRTSELDERHWKGPHHDCAEQIQNKVNTEILLPAVLCGVMTVSAIFFFVSLWNTVMEYIGAPFPMSSAHSIVFAVYTGVCLNAAFHFGLTATALYKLRSRSTTALKLLIKALAIDHILAYVTAVLSTIMLIYGCFRGNSLPSLYEEIARRRFEHDNVGVAAILMYYGFIVLFGSIMSIPVIRQAKKFVRDCEMAISKTNQDVE